MTKNRPRVAEGGERKPGVESDLLRTGGNPLEFGGRRGTQSAHQKLVPDSRRQMSASNHQYPNEAKWTGGGKAEVLRDDRTRFSPYFSLQDAGEGDKKGEKETP